MPIGTEFIVNTYTESRASNPVIAVAATGEVLVVWDDRVDRDGDSVGVFAQRLDETGGRLGSDFQVNSYTIYIQQNPAVAAVSNGFVVAWSGNDNAGDTIVAQRLAASGARLGTEILVQAGTGIDHDDPSVAGAPDGGFLVAWEREGRSGQDGIFVRRFDSDGTPIGAAVRLNETTGGDQSDPILGATRGGQFVVVWEDGDFVSNGTDGDGKSVVGQRFELAP